MVAGTVAADSQSSRVGGLLEANPVLKRKNQENAGLDT
jgi:hypothetical protein